MQKRVCLQLLYSTSTTNKVLNRLRQRYSKEQRKLLEKIQKSRLKLHSLTLKLKFLQSCIINRVVPKYIEFKIKRSNLKCSPIVKRMFLKDEIGRLKSVKKYVKSFNGFRTESFRS